MSSDMKERLKEGEFVTGIFAKSRDGAFVEAAGRAGFDFVIIDMEHGPLTLPQVEDNCRAAACGGITPVVRIKTHSQISSVLDSGAVGCQAPHVDDAPSARAAVSQMRYGEGGERGVCRFVRAAGYSSVPKQDYFSAANARTLAILQVEGKKGHENLDEILQVPGIDVIFIGPYDLSASLGMPGEIEDDAVTGAMEDIVKRCAAARVATGTFVETVEQHRRWRETGVQYLAYSVDVGIFLDACRAIVTQTRGR